MEKVKEQMGELAHEKSWWHEENAEEAAAG